MVVQRREQLKVWARTLKRDVMVLWLAAREPRVPWAAKLLAGAVAGYALSPIDLVPDFIPVFGYLDDLLIVPLGVWAAVKLIPAPVLAELRRRAEQQQRPRSVTGLVIVASVWLAAVILTAAVIWPAVGRL